MGIPTEHIRNFCIIAHIDHGKSTLADRLLELTGAVSDRDKRDQVLDSMDLERERGITIKASAVSFRYPVEGQEYLFNLIDTPGHVDFSYEVSRALAACEGALLLVDAAQGVEAQTVANLYHAVEAGIEIVPAINKVDLGAARVAEVTDEIWNGLGLKGEEILKVSAKTGLGVVDVLPAIVHRIPAPKGDPEASLAALIFDSEFDDYRGVIIYMRIMSGRLRKGESVRLLGTGRRYEALELGTFRPAMTPCPELAAGEVGYLIANIKEMADIRVGDTVAHATDQEAKPLPGYREPRPMVFCGLYPTNNADYPALRKALERLKLNDASFTFEPETSEALGFGFRCGFLGLLHMEIVQERLERESDIDLVQTAPNVTYEVLKHDGEVIHIDSPAALPDMGVVQELREPLVQVSLIIPSEHIGAAMKLNEEKRGNYLRTEYISPQRVILVYEVPLAEMVYDYYDRLKSATRGYGTMDYEFVGYRESDLARLNILVGGMPVDALSCIVHRQEADYVGRRIIRKLQKEIPRHLFDVPLQAAIGAKIIARETIKALRKNVTAKCYGGDITRKRKLLEKQKEGKKRMKSVGNVEIPQKAFLAALESRTAEEK